MEKRMKDDFVLQQDEQIESPSDVVAEEVGWSWKRKALQRCKAGINLYVRFNIIDDIKRELGIIGAGVYQEFVNSCFGHFLQFHWEGYNNAALHALIAQEITKVDAPTDEIWIRIGEQCIRFSKYEYALVTGLRFGDSTFDPNVPHDPPKEGVYGRLLQSEGRLVLDDLRDCFTRGEFRQSAADALKVAKVLFVYYMLFGLDGRQTSVERWVWALVEDRERWESFPWGKYSFQILVHYIRGLPVRLRQPQPERRRPSSYHFYGCSFALLIWGCEAIPLLGSTCGSRVSTYQLPRCLRWTFRKMSVDMTDFFFNQMVCFPTLEPSIDEQQRIYWQHIDEDLCSGIQYVHRDNRFKRFMSSTATTATTTAAPAQRPRTSRTDATTSAASIPVQRSKTFKNHATTSATSILSQRSQKRQRIDLSDSDGRGIVCDSRMLTFIREEVVRIQKRIPEIIRKELKHLFPYIGMRREKQDQEEEGRDNFFDFPLDPSTTDAGRVAARSVTPVARKPATFAPPPDSPVTSGGDTSTTSTPPVDPTMTSCADTITISTPPPDTSVPLDHRTPETDASKAYGEELVGSKEKDCRPKSKTFSEGVVASYNQSHKKQLVLYTNGTEELVNLRKHVESAKGVSADQAQKAHLRAHDLSYMCADNDVGKKHKGKPFDLKTRSASPTLCKDKKMENMEAGIAPIDSKLQAIPGDDSVRNVNGYKVKTSAAPTLDAIFHKYGDIAAHCIYKSTSVRASLLEVVCNVVQRLQYDDVDAILSDLDVIENELSDVEASKIEVSWLHEHLAKLHRIAPFKERCIELRKSKAKGNIVVNAAINEVRERQAEVRLAQERVEEAEKRADVMTLVLRKIEDDIAESELEEWFWRRRLDHLL